MLGVEVNGPDPVRMPVRAKTEGVYREVVELVAAGRCSGLVDEADGRAVIGVDTTAVLVKGAAEEPRELREHERQVVLAAGAVPGSGTRAIFQYDIVRVEVEIGPVVTLPDRIEYDLGAMKLGWLLICCRSRCRCRRLRMAGADPLDPFRLAELFAGSVDEAPRSAAARRNAHFVREWMMRPGHSGTEHQRRTPPSAAVSGKTRRWAAGLAAKLLESITGPHLAPQPVDVEFSSHGLTPPIAICSTVCAGTGQPLDSSWNARSEAKPPAYSDSTAR